MYSIYTAVVDNYPLVRPGWSGAMCGEHHGVATARIITRARGDIDTSPSPGLQSAVCWLAVTDFWWLLQFSQAAVYCLVMKSTGH